MRTLGWVLLLGAAGCTSNADGSLTGQPPGGGFEIVDTISATVTMSDGAGDSSASARIVMTSTANQCSDAGASPAIDRKGEHFIAIQLSDVSGGIRTAPTAPGTYTIYPNTGSEPAKSASFDVGAFDNTCQLVDEDTGSGQSGTVTLTSVTGGVYAGSYDVTLNTGDHVAGSFAPTACPQLSSAAANDTQHSCS
jgi:hypothetical protein